MNKCPICNRKAKVFHWYRDGQIEEWLIQCSSCKYMKHWSHGGYKLTVGSWHKSIGFMTIKKNKKKADKIFNQFYQEIKKAKESYLFKKEKL